ISRRDSIKWRSADLKTSRQRLNRVHRPFAACMLIVTRSMCAQSVNSPVAVAAGRPSATTTSASSVIKVATDLQRAPDRSIAQPAALVPIFEQLLRIGEIAPEPVHIIHFGDSHTASDDLTVRLRQLLKERFGDGGSGFSLPGRPFKSYRRFDVHGGATVGWRTAGLLASPRDAYVGLGGVGIFTRDPGQSVFLSADCDYLEIYYLQQPEGGDLALFEQDRLLEKFSTAGEQAPGILRRQLAPGPHRLMLKTLSPRPVRLFGWVADKRSGITYESVGIDGVEASIMLRWDEKMF